jgi:pseudomonalisin
MIKKWVIAAIIFGTALSGLSGIRAIFAAENASIDENDRVILHGNINPNAKPEYDVGPTDPSLPVKQMILVLKIAPEKQYELDRLLAEQQDPSSANFHHWLTPKEFGKRFGLSPREIATVKNWLISQGFTIEETAKGGTRINFSGTVAEVERAFHVRMHDYFVKGHLYHANSTDPSIPRSLANLVAGPLKLNNFRYKAMQTPRPRGAPTKTLDRINRIYRI